MDYVRHVEHADIVHRCFRCGYCKFPSDYVDFNCPSYKAYGWDTFSPGGRMWLIRAWLSGEIKSSPRFAQVMFSCAACDNCKEQCVFPRFKDYLPEVFQETRTELVNEGLVPVEVRNYFKSLTLYGNPYRMPQKERTAWASGLGLTPYEGQEYLFYVGCVGSYDEEGKKMARKVAEIMLRAGVSFGILGENEICDGNDVRTMGEMGLFHRLKEENEKSFRSRGVKKIVTLDPHAFNAFKKYYDFSAGEVEIFHYAELFSRLLREKKVKFAFREEKVTYHDPCYLGRHNGIYDPPREILRAVAGKNLVEMRRHGADAFCCGGGGGNFFTDLLGRKESSPALIRIREAKETGAQVLVTACPLCTKMLVDAEKQEGGERLKVMSLPEFVFDAMEE